MKTSRRIRIGTRDSALALYQAHDVQQKLNQRGISTEIVEITSDGDLDLVTPLYEMGIQGIFTKSLDVALLQNKIDLAVHSTKDVPTKLAQGLILSAILERATPFDCLVLPQSLGGIDLEKNCTIATSSLRRRTQWLHHYPNHTTENLRGNIQTRLKKLDQSAWHGAIFAQAALERLDVTTYKIITLDWMLPSPSQGAIGVVCRRDDPEAIEICQAINHKETNICVNVERDFLAALHGGCAVPIAAYANIVEDQIFFRGNVFSLDAKKKCEVTSSFSISMASEVGVLAAKELLAQGAGEIIKTFRPVE